MKKRILGGKIVSVVFATLLIFSLILAGCAQPSPTPEPTETPQLVIGVLISMTEATPFFVTLRAGSEEAAARLSVELTFQYADEDAETQSAQLRAMVEQGVSAVLLNPVSDAVVPAIAAANDAGIPVFTIDRGVAGGEIVCHIASDNLAGGEMAGDYLAEVMGKKGNVVELQGTPGSSAAQDRGAGFNQALATYPEVNVVARQTANFNYDDGKAVFAQILAEHAAIDGVFAHNDDMILGAIAAAQEAGRVEGIKFVGFDAIDDAIAAIERGDLLATIAQQPAEIGRLGVETAVEHLKGKSVPSSIPVDLALITE